MKTIKPQKLSVLHRTFENGRKHYFVPTVMLFFPFESPSVPLHEVHMWKTVGTEIGNEVALDEFMWKSKGEVLVTGRAYAPGGEPQPAVAARVQLGKVDKQLYVVGDRRWTRAGTATDPVPFTQMPITWSRAFGGAGFDKNPRGAGVGPVEDPETGEAYHPLPNVENPKKLIKSPSDRPDPVGFGAMDISLPQRQQNMGTYDQKWLEERYPGYAEDLDWSVFNTASPDQWIDAYFSGDERFVVENMHPDKPKLEARLPGLNARIFITREGEEEKLEEVALRIDTVHLFPHLQRGIVVFRGVTEVLEDDAADIMHLVAACERPDAPRPLSHYRRVLTERLDKERGYLFALRDSDLMPERDPDAPPVEQEKLGDTEEHARIDNFVAQNMRRKAEKALENAKQQISDLGLDPSEFAIPAELPPAPGTPDVEDMPEFVEKNLALAEEARLDALKKKDEMLAQTRALCEQAGVDFDAKVAEAKSAEGGPPTFSADAEMERLENVVTLGRNAGVPMVEAEAKIRDPELLQKLEQAEATLKDMYRRFAHHYPAAASLEGDEATRLRGEVERALAAGESLADRDLTGADLHGLDLTGVDLSGAFVEGANLSGAVLSGADLRNCVLARADLSEANLSGATGAGANFGQAKLGGANLSGNIDFEGAVFNQADLAGATLAGARLQNADLQEACLSGADLSGIKAEHALFMRNDLSGTTLTGCEIHHCNLFEVNLSGADLSGASLRESALVTANCEGAKFDGADCENLRVVLDTNLAGASFKNATLVKANLRSCNLAGCDFTEANLAGADLSESNLTSAIFDLADAPKALIMKANLTGATLQGANLLEALLQKSNLCGANFRGANLFRADFARVKRDENTCFDDANMKHIRFVKRADE